MSLFLSLLFAVVYGFVGLVLTVDLLGMVLRCMCVAKHVIGAALSACAKLQIFFIVTNFLLGFVVCRMVRRVVADG